MLGILAIASVIAALACTGRGYTLPKGSSAAAVYGLAAALFWFAAIIFGILAVTG